MSTKTLGEELLFAVDRALASKKKGRVLRPAIDIPMLRKQLKMTQSVFSKSYNINLETLRNWEQGKRNPDSVSMTYLNCIAKHPTQMLHILND